MGGALNARPAKLVSPFPSLGPMVGSPLSETLSEREHRQHAGRLHDMPRLLDRPPQLQRAGSFHSGHGELVSPDEAIVMSPSPSRLSASGSDHTIEALRTPPSMHPNERVVRAELLPINVNDSEQLLLDPATPTQLLRRLRTRFKITNRYL